MPNIVTSFTPKSLKDEWQTPDYLFNLLNREFNFVADLAAQHYNTKVPARYSNNSLKVDWVEHFGEGNYFLNPPFSKLGMFLRKAIGQYSLHQGKEFKIVMLYNYEMSFTQKRVRLCLKDDSNFVQFPGEIRILVPRLNYVNFYGYIENRVTFNSCVHIIDGTQPETFSETKFWLYKEGV